MKEEAVNGSVEFFAALKRAKRARYNFSRVENKSVLVLAPHADDEMVGCGGTLIKLINEGFQVEVILFTEEYESEIDRVGEFKEALKVIGCHKVIILGHIDGDLLKYKEEAKQQVLAIMDKFSPGLIFSPYLLDETPDHKAANLILYECLLEKSLKNEDVLIAMYEVWAPLIYADYYLDISVEFKLKEQALNCYESQEKRYKIINKAKKLNALRADLSFRRNIEYMEAFQSLHINEFIKAVEFLLTNNWLEN